LVEHCDIWYMLLVPTVISTYHMEIIHVHEHMKFQEGDNDPQNMYYSHHHYGAITQPLFFIFSRNAYKQSILQLI